ncbi:hypothetical protein GV793_10455 [Nocardia cyriacigeorgica]|nr:hypothetical protein [Nocardia cyriacigeorgica]
MHLGIIGAGAAAVGLIDALASTETPPDSVTVFDGSSAVWRGRAYQPDAASVRVNAPPAIMSVRAGDRTHYEHWLRERHGDDTKFLDDGLGVTLVPRGVYGDYLEQTATAALARLRSRGVRVSIVNDHVSASTGEDGTVLRAVSGSLHPVDKAVLCVGSGRPRDHYGLTGIPGYVGEPYPLTATLADIPTDSHIAVLGSGLTAVDIAVTLAARGHTGPISLVSRSGALPDVQQRPVPLTPAHLTPARVLDLLDDTLTFDRLVALMRAELADLGQDFDSFAAELLDAGREDPLVRLRRQVAQIDSPHLGRRLLVMAIRTVGPIAWPRLADADRTMLRTTYFRTIAGLSSPMVPLNARILLRLLDSGQVRLRSGVTKVAARSGGGFTVHDSEEWAAEHVFNAVNPSAGTTAQDAESLVGGLLADGAAELGADGGLRTDYRTGALVVAGRPSPVWSVLGNLAAESMFIATNPPGLAAEAAALAGHLTRS